MRRHLVRPAAFVLSLSLALPGCSLHPRAPELFEHDYHPESSGKKHDDAPEPLIRYAGDLPAAIDDVDAQRRAYIESADKMSARRAAAPLAVTAMTAAALGLGISGSGGTVQTAIAALGLTGASVMALTTFYDSRPRQRLYYEAAQALGCAIVSMSPALMVDEDYTGLEEALEALAVALPTAEAALGAAERARAALPDPAAQVRMDAQLAIAREVLLRAHEVHGQGVRLRGHVRRAGFSLRERAKDIVLEVDKEIVKTEPDPNSIRSALAGLGVQARGLVTLPPGAAPGAPGAPGAGDVEVGGIQSGGVASPEELAAAARLADLRAALYPVERWASAVALHLGDAESAAKAFEAVEACKPPKVAAGLRIIPNVDAIAVRPPASPSFTILGVATVPRASLSSTHDLAGSTAIVDLAGGAFVAMVNVTAGAAPGDAKLVITDASGTEVRTVDVRILAKSPGATRVTGGTPGVGKNLTEFEKTLLSNVIAMLQRELGTGDDGTIGKNTRDALESYLKTHRSGEPAIRAFDQGVFDFARDRALAKVAGAASLPGDTVSDAAAVSRLQTLLGVSETGTLDRKTRQKVWAWQETWGYAITGALDHETVRRIGAEFGSGNTENPAGAATTGAFARNQVEMVQRTVGAPLSGALDDGTNTAIENLLAQRRSDGEEPPAFGTALDQPVYDYINGLAREAALADGASHTDFVREDSDDLRDVQRRLGVADSAKLDPATRGAVWDHQAKIESLTITGSLDRDTFRHIGQNVDPPRQ